MFMMRAQNKGEVNNERGKIESEGKQCVLCLVLPAYEKFHTTSSCDVISCVASTLDTSDI
jgi:hypothetical protein